MTGIVSIYLWFMVAQMEHLVHKLDGEMNLLSGIFCALRLYKKKIDMFFALIGSVEALTLFAPWQDRQLAGLAAQTPSETS